MDTPPTSSPPSAALADQVLVDVVEALATLSGILPLNSRDFSADPLDALLYAILVGWGCEDDVDDPEHVHDDICGGDGAFDDIATRYRWSAGQRDRVRRYRAAVAALVPA